MTKLCVARAWAKLRVRDTRIHLQQWENPVWIQTRAEPRAYRPSPHATVWVGDPTLPTDQQSLKGFRQPTVPFRGVANHPVLQTGWLLPLYCANPPGQLCFAELTQTLAHDQNR